MEIEGGEKEILLAGEAIEVSYGKVDDVLVNGTSVVENKIADIKLKTINNQAVDGTGNIQIDGVTDYNQLNNRPQINGTTLSGNKTGGELGLQNYTDNDLATTSKTIVGAINEVDNLAKGANQALSFSNYEAMITEFNSAPVDKYKVGQNIYVLTLDVPDLWVSSVEDTSVYYTYTTDSAFISALETNGYVQVGYYKLSALETQEVDLTDYVSKSGLLQSTGTATDNTMSQDAITTQLGTKANASDVVTDVQINSTSIKNNGVANIPLAGNNTFGVIKGSNSYGVYVSPSGVATTTSASTSEIDAKTNDYKCIVPKNLDYAIEKGLGDNQLTWTDTEKTNARTTIGAVGKTDYAGTTSANPGIVWAQISRGIELTADGEMKIQRASDGAILAKSSGYYPITPSGLDYAVKVGVTTNTNTLSASEKTNAQTWLGFVTCTQAEYDALVLAGTVDSGTYYHIIEE